MPSKMVELVLEVLVELEVVVSILVLGGSSGSSSGPHPANTRQNPHTTTTEESYSKHSS